jgi:hypothetical protein
MYWHVAGPSSSRQLITSYCRPPWNISSLAWSDLFMHPLAAVMSTHSCLSLLKILFTFNDDTYLSLAHFFESGDFDLFVQLRMFLH